MKKEILRKIIIFTVVALLLVLCAVMVKSCTTPPVYTTVEGKLERVLIEEDENRVILIIEGNDAPFIWYKKTFSLEYALELEIGCEVSLVVQEDYQEFKYALITILTIDGEVIFDNAQEFLEEDKEIAYIFAVTLITLCLTLIYIAFFPLKDIEQPENGFIISPHKAVFYFGLLVTVPAITTAITMFLIGSKESRFIGFSVLFFALIGILLIYSYFKERFECDGQKFTYYHLFGKISNAYIDEIKLIKIERSNFLQIIFISKDNKKLIRFLDDGTAFRNGEFFKKLAQHNIPLVNSVYRKQFKATQELLKQSWKFGELTVVNLRVCVSNIEHFVTFTSKRCVVKNWDSGEELFTFSSFKEFVNAPIYNGNSLYSLWKKVEAFEYVIYPINKTQEL